MRKFIFYRLAAVILFCFAFLIIKSESGTCTACLKKDLKTVTNKSVSRLANSDSFHPYDGFFIKI